MIVVDIEVYWKYLDLGNWSEFFFIRKMIFYVKIVLRFYILW